MLASDVVVSARLVWATPCHVIEREVAPWREDWRTAEGEGEGGGKRIRGWRAVWRPAESPCVTPSGQALSLPPQIVGCKCHAQVPQLVG